MDSKMALFIVIVFQICSISAICGKIPACYTAAISTDKHIYRHTWLCWKIMFKNANGSAVISQH